MQECLGRLRIVPSHKSTGSFPELLKGARVSVWTSGPLGLGTCHGSDAAGRGPLRGQALPLGMGTLPGADRTLLTGRQASGSRGHQHPSHPPVPQGPLSRWGPGGGEPWPAEVGDGAAIVPRAPGRVPWSGLMNQPGWAFQRLQTEDCVLAAVLQTSHSSGYGAAGGLSHHLSQSHLSWVLGTAWPRAWSPPDPSRGLRVPGWPLQTTP